MGHRTTSNNYVVNPMGSFHSLTPPVIEGGQASQSEEGEPPSPAGNSRMAPSWRALPRLQGWILWTRCQEPCLSQVPGQAPSQEGVMEARSQWCSSRPRPGSLGWATGTELWWLLVFLWERGRAVTGTSPNGCFEPAPLPRPLSSGPGRASSAPQACSAPCGSGRRAFSRPSPPCLVRLRLAELPARSFPLKCHLTCVWPDVPFFTLEEKATGDCVPH